MVWSRQGFGSRLLVSACLMDVRVGLPVLQSRSCSHAVREVMMTCVERLGREDIHWHNSSISPLRSSFSKSELTFSFAVCVQFVLVARFAGCVLAEVVFHDCLLGKLYRFSPGFSLINWSIIFFLINEIDMWKDRTRK